MSRSSEFPMPTSPLSQLLERNGITLLSSADTKNERGVYIRHGLFRLGRWTMGFAVRKDPKNKFDCY